MDKYEYAMKSLFYSYCGIAIIILILIINEHGNKM